MLNYKLLGVLAIILLRLLAGHAQVTTASISGIVMDERGAVLPRAAVSVRNLETSSDRTVLSDSVGRYRITGLMPGVYEVSAELPRFKTEMKDEIKLTLGEDLTLDFTLKVGEVTEQVSVSVEPSGVENNSSALSGIVDDRKIRDLPLNARSFIQLSFLQPGVVEFKFGRDNINQGRGTKISINGLRPTSNSFLLDGTYLNDAVGRTPGSVAGIFLGIDTVREFRVLTNSFSAEYGMAAGGVISAVTKSGTNDLHGSAFWFHRNDNLDARNFFDLQKPEFRRHQFGVTAGGPLKRGRTFFFGAGEWFRQAKGVTRVAQVPSVAAREGQIVAIADVVRPYLNLFPVPNGEDLGGGLAEHRFAQDEAINESFFQLRVDHALSAGDRIFGRYTFDSAASVLSAPTPNTLVAVDELSRNQYLTLEHTKIISEQLLNIARLAFNRTNTSATNHFLQEVDPSLSFAEGRPLGVLRIPGIGEWGPNRSLPFVRLRNLFSFSDDLVYASGRHSIKSGLTVNRFQDNDISSFVFDGLYEFPSINDFLRGRPNRLRIATADSTRERGWRQWLFGFYVQDDFKASKDLTLNLGLRYEFTTVIREVQGRALNIRDALEDADLTLGDPMYRNPSLRNFAPRIGFAFDPFGTGKTAIRGGFGLYFEPYLYPLMFPAHQSLPPFSQVGSLRNPTFPRQPLPASIPNRDQSIGVSAFDAENPYSMQYNLNIQREVLADLILTVGYAGSRGIHLMRGGNINRPVPQTINGRSFFPAGAPRRYPNWGDLDVKRGDGNSWYNSLQINAQKRFSRGFQFQASYTFSRTIDEGSGAVSSDIVTGATDLQDIDNRRNERGLSAFHVKHLLVFNYTFDLPFMQRQSGWSGKILGGWQVNGITTMRSGMPFTVAVTTDRARAGLPDPGTMRPDMIDGASISQAILGAEGFRRTGRYYDPFVFALPPPGFPGSVGRNTLIGPDLINFDFSLVKNSKVKLLGEGGNLQLRLELFNIFNRANFSQPDPLVFTGTATQPNPACAPQFECPLPSAGRITSTTTGARQIQLGVKVIF